MPNLSFPPDFAWGTATSSYQIEGASSEDGRGRCIWDDFCRRPGAVHAGENGDVACDHYHRWEADLDLIKNLGIRAYRFSVSWPRILPEGRGAINRAGLDFYDRLVDGMLARGIEPFLTQYHWDLPQTLEQEGGWRNRDTASAFADYAQIVAEALGDRVRHWTTFNEMWCIIELGHREGHHAPGRKDPERSIRQTAHHVLLAHGLGVQRLRAAAPEAHAGVVHLAHAPVPFSERPVNIDLAREEFRRRNGWLLSPIFLGRYPEEEWDQLAGDQPDVQPGDLEIISQPLDYFGLNCYSGWDIVDADTGARPVETHYPRTGFGWPITPDCLYWGARFTRDLYTRLPIYITENGAAYPDAPNGDGSVSDYARIAYLRQHLAGVHRALREGIDIRGYFVWSLLDNFEWAFGYSQRFGLVHVDFDTLKRTPKLSSKWYSQVIEDNGM